MGGATRTAVRAVAGALVIAVLASCAPSTPPPAPSSTPAPEAIAPGPPPALTGVVDAMAWSVIEVAVGDGMTVPFVVRVARTESERTQGLQRVPALPDGVGMLFLFPDEGSWGGFWMRETLVPLDIAFLDAAGRIVALAAMEPCLADPCPITDPGLPYAAALEVGAGALARAGAEVGAVVRWTEPRDGSGPDA